MPPATPVNTPSTTATVPGASAASDFSTPITVNNANPNASATSRTGIGHNRERETRNVTKAKPTAVRM